MVTLGAALRGVHTRAFVVPRTVRSHLRRTLLPRAPLAQHVPDEAKSAYNASLTKIAAALRAHHLPNALLHWHAFPQDSPLTLPDATLKSISRLFVSSFLPAPNSPKWSTSKLDAATAFALYASQHHSAEPLALLMLYHLSHSDPDAVFQLYKQYHQLCPSLPNPHNSSLALPDIDPEHDSDSEQRASVAVALLAAYSITGDLKSAFNDFQSLHIVPVRIYRTHPILLKLARFDSRRAKLAQSFIDKVMMAHLVSRPPSFSRFVLNFNSMQSGLSTFYDRLMDALSGPHPYIAPSEDHMSDQHLVALTESEWSSLQAALVKLEQLHLAAKLWDKLTALGVKPSVTMWNGLLSIHAKLRSSREAMSTWNMMLAQGVQPNDLSYRAVIAALFDDNMPKQALERFREYQTTIDRRDSQSIIVYNAVLSALLRINSIDDANILKTYMERHGPALNHVAYNTFLAYYGRQKSFDGISKILSEMEDANVVPDVVTFSTILSALLAVGRRDAPFIILNLMRKQGIRPTVATYTTIIDDQMRQETPANFQAALTLLNKMEKEDGVLPNEVTYTAILSGIYRGSWLSREQADSYRRHLTAKMRSQNIHFRLPTYHILIRAALASADKNGYLDALAYIEEMQEKNIPCVATTWYILLSGLMKRGLWTVADDVVSKMSGSGYVSNGRLERMIAEIKRRVVLK